MDIMEYDQQRKRLNRYDMLVAELNKVNLAISDMTAERNPMGVFTFELSIGGGRTTFQRFVGSDLDFARDHLISAFKARAVEIVNEIKEI